MAIDGEQDEVGNPKIEAMLRSFWDEESRAVQDRNELDARRVSADVAPPDRAELHRRLAAIDAQLRRRKLFRFSAIAATVIFVLTGTWYMSQRGHDRGTDILAFASTGLSVHSISATRGESNSVFWVGDRVYVTLTLARPAHAFVVAVKNSGGIEQVGQPVVYSLSAGEVRLPPTGAERNDFELGGASGKQSFLVVLSDQSLPPELFSRTVSEAATRASATGREHEDMLRVLLSEIQKVPHFQAEACTFRLLPKE